MKLRRLPIGTADFEKIIQNKAVYVDKTDIIYRLIDSGDCYFLSRPRRFGKSLLVSTLRELFSGNKELFKNQWIYTSDYDWQEHPVLFFDFSIIGHRTAPELLLGIQDALHARARHYNIDLSQQNTLSGKLEFLIEQLSQKNRVVILVDEYDKPILDHIDNLEHAKEQREILKSFYTVLKGMDRHLRFVLLTGVSKFSKTSVFSGFNNLNDISLDPRYATLLGYTRDEIARHFPEHLSACARKLDLPEQELIQEIAHYYDGYEFAENSERVFNPFSVLLFFDKQKFGDYWFETGTPTFLIKLLQKQDYDLKGITHPIVSSGSLGSFEPDKIPLVSLLFQTGYLTIKEYDSKANTYTFGVPNKEVHDGLTLRLVDAFTQLPSEQSLQYAKILTHAFVENNMTELQEKLQEFFNRMPYVVHVTDEHKLQFVLYAIFALIGVAVDPEVMTSTGRADLVVEFPKHVFVIELKFNGSAQQALDQIKDKKYYEKYENTNRQITLVGINFEQKTKTISLASHLI